MAGGGGEVGGRGGAICSFTLRLSLGWHLAAVRVWPWHSKVARSARDFDEWRVSTSTLGLQGSGAESEQQELTL